MENPIKRYVIVEDSSEYVKCIMEIPVKSQLLKNEELRDLYLAFVDPIVDDEECLERMRKFIERFKNKTPKKDLELK